MSRTWMQKLRSPLWTALLLPFLFLPYRWLWIPCAVGAALLLWPSRGGLRDLLARDGTIVIGSVLVLILRTALDPGWWLPWLAVVGALLLVRRGMQIPVMVGLPASLLAIAGCFLWLGRPNFLSRPKIGEADPGAVLVCVGDSLTSGVNLKSDANTYVARLRERFQCPVINAGVANDKVRDVQKRLERDVLARKPSAVLLFIGGNDYLDGTGRAAFAAGLDEIAGRIAASGARLAIVEVPTGIVWDPYFGIYRAVARRYGATLIPESRLRIWFSIELLARGQLEDALTLDGIQLSDSGARRVADWLQPFVESLIAIGQQRP